MPRFLFRRPADASELSWNLHKSFAVDLTLNKNGQEYNRYGHQYQYFQRIVAVYETEPDNYPRLMELMADIQEYGQPPSEIIKELAPGLEFNEEGMPIMPGMGNSTMPEEGGPGRPMGMPGMPIPSGEAGQCTLS